MKIPRYLDKIKPDMRAVHEYFGCKGKGASAFKMGLPFTPSNSIVSQEAPWQLHHSARHDGVFVRMNAMGCPDMTNEFIEMLDAIPWEVMRDATSYVLRVSDKVQKDYYGPLMAMSNRSFVTTKYRIAQDLNMSYGTLMKQLEIACALVVEYLDDWLLEQKRKRDTQERISG